MSNLPNTVKRYLQSIGRKGGSAKSPAKTKAVRANGKLGAVLKPPNPR